MTMDRSFLNSADKNASLSNKSNFNANDQYGDDNIDGNKKTQTNNGSTNRIECPCHNYTALSKIVDIISSGDRARTDSMIEWLNGDTDRIAIRQKKLLTCGKRFQCRFRYGTSFAILRAIRESCAPFQTPATTASNSRPEIPLEKNKNNTSVSLDSESTNMKAKSGSAGYDQSFPPLLQHPGQSNILTPPSREKNLDKSMTTDSFSAKSSGSTTVHTLKGRKKKSKGRVEPQLIQASTLRFPGPAINGPPFERSINSQKAFIRNEKNRTDINKESKNNPIISSRATSAINIPGATTSSSKERIQSQPLSANSPSTSLSPTPSWGAPNAVNDINIRLAKIDDSNHSHQSTGVPERNDLVKAPSKSSTKVSEMTTEQMSRLVDIYIALIRNMLVPSTPLEIHLMLELLSLESNAISTNSRERSQRNPLYHSPKRKVGNESAVVTGPVLFFQPIFSGPEQCIHFARCVLTRLLEGIIQRLSPFLIKSLLEDGVFVSRCPVIAEHLNTFLLESSTSIEWTVPTSESVIGTHAIFSLPFEPDRDSRHNFKTPAEISMYQNREVTRDAFLSGLRDFITAKSKVFLPQQVDKVRDSAKFESRKIISNISSQNMLWFAQFFCELLLQVGLAPVEEMDQELLQIVADDRDKLQKLHKRFFKKSPSRSYQPKAGFGTTSGTTARRNERDYHNGKSNETKSPSISIFHEVLTYFPGYQEFFFIFLHSTNSYNFGMHLLQHVVKKTSDMVSNKSFSGLEKRTLELGLLARFLGVLIFSPNWHDESIGLNKLKPCICSLDHGLDLLDSIGLPLSKLVKESWDNGYTFLVIPWVTELLKMSKWDSISQASMNYRQILANLRFVQSFTSSLNSGEYRVYGSNMQLVSFHVETFFNETFSLPKLTSLPDSNLVLLPHFIADSLDNHKLAFSKPLLYACSPHMEDLCDMIMMSKQSMKRDLKSSSIKPRKLKPSIVSSIEATKARAYLEMESPVGKVLSPLSNANRKKGSMVDNSLHGKKIHAQNKLTEGFFHQHRDLKEICEFVVEQTLKTLSVDEIRIFVVKASEEFSIGNQSTETEIEEMQVRALELSNEFLRNKLATRINKTLDLFCPAGVHRRVIDLATNLSTVRGMEESNVLVRGLISDSTKTVLKQLETTTTTTGCNSKKATNHADNAIESAAASIRSLVKNYSADVNCELDVRLIEEAVRRVTPVTKSVLIPHENVLRDFFECIVGLEPISESVIARVVQSNTPDSWVRLCTFFSLLEKLALLSGFWRNKINILFGENYVLISDGKCPSSSEKEILLQQLSQFLLERRRNSYIIKDDNDQDDLKYEGFIRPMKIQFQ